MRRIFAEAKWIPGLSHVNMKTRRAKVHLDALEREVGTWVKRPPYTVVEQDDLDKAWHYYMVGIHEVPEEIPMLVGDFVCCLRSALDQLAWNLAHIDRSRVFGRGEEKRINFPIFGEQESIPTYLDRRKLFPATVAVVLDSFQPYIGGDAYRDDPSGN